LGRDAIDTPLFFFSSRRRHTRFSRDWSSDVCSSDLAKQVILQRIRDAEREQIIDDFLAREEPILSGTVKRVDREGAIIESGKVRSAERRVGKETSPRGDPCGERTNEHRRAEPALPAT